MLEVKDFSFRYSKETDYLWSPLSFTAAKGTIIVVKGRNGSGKTTLLRCLCRIIPHLIEGETTGKIFYNGKDLATIPFKQIAPEINMLFQDPDNQIFMPIVEEEIAFGAENLCLDKEEIKERLSKQLERFKIEHLRTKNTGNLSFGQKKLVALAGLLVISPQVLLLDEFAAGLEEKVVTDFANYSQELREEGKILIFAEHHPAFDKIADLTIRLN